MNKASNVIIVLSGMLVFFASQLLSQTRQRSEVPVKDRWKLEDLYASDDEIAALNARIVRLLSF